MQELLCDPFLGASYGTLGNVPQPCIDAPALANLLHSLPIKPVCDLLVRSFLVGVRPICPLVHVPTFRTDYDNFWAWYSNADTTFPNSKLINDPTFLCLLFAVLYCGAVAAPSLFWAAEVLQSLKRELLLEQLKNFSSAGLKLCQYLRYPTFNTLVASLLRHSCLKTEGEPFEDLGFVSMMVRIAQSMGLHREGSQFGLDAVSCEMRRRVWWHLLWLDVQDSIYNGSEPCCSNNNARRDVQMVGETRDEDILESSTSLPSPLKTPSSGISSALMLFAIGRFETVRFERFMINRLDDVQGLEQAHFHDVISAVQRLHLKIDGLIARMPAQGVPEKGFIPTRVANASPLTHERLFEDHLNEPTVFTSWARIMLTMLKAESAIVLTKYFLDRADVSSQREQSRWKTYVLPPLLHDRHLTLHKL